jgi:hypothetical protein
VKRGLLVLLVAASACARSNEGPQVTAIDLLKTSDRAEKRPAGARFEVMERSCGSGRIPGLEVPAPSRIIYRLNVPVRARLATIPSLDGPADAAAEFRIGISDRRTYETLMTRTITGGTCVPDLPMIVDLSRYAGWQWSLFYRPDERTWELILGVSVVGGVPASGNWGVPRIEADSRSVRAFAGGRR